MITKAALLLFRENLSVKELLFVRVKTRDYFIFPGGKQEKNETIDEALQRELIEELGSRVVHINKLGIVSGKTPDGRDLEMHLYSGELLDEPNPQAEIEEIMWMSKKMVKNHTAQMTPMTLNHVMPFLDSRNIW